ncbi:hypothetical protein, partial [Oleidesulfovibrio alaskensis]|uniref:hypothetical protein n=1 Tax=Oleidesulfovibrio alaskensis TaxID=58180 RepID=UPI002352B304
LSTMACVIRVTESFIAPPELIACAGPVWLIPALPPGKELHGMHFITDSAARKLGLTVFLRWKQ